jgi:hypothetical protein
MKHLILFDLDATIFCSKHRQLTDENGALDLIHWRENSTKEKVLSDKPLPLINFWRASQKSQHIQIAICTARFMSEHDYQLIRMHGLKFHHDISRQGETDTRPDHELKREGITSLLVKMRIPTSRWKSAVSIYDDNRKVLKMARQLGIKTFDSITLNKRLLA